MEFNKTELVETKRVFSFYLTPAVMRSFQHLCVDLGKGYNGTLAELIAAYNNTGNPYDTISVGYESGRQK